MKYIYYLLGLPHIVSFLLYRSLIKEIREDLFAFSGGISVSDFVEQLSRKEYRGVFYYRLPFLLRQLLNFILPRERTLYLHTSQIGGGMNVQHGFSTIIVAESIGRNFYVHQNVTVGWNHDGKPIIGDNVRIFTGAVVAGPIHIGNNVTIAANSVVLKDIPDHCLVYGNPCVIKMDNKVKRS